MHSELKMSNTLEAPTWGASFYSELQSRTRSSAVSPGCQPWKGGNRKPLTGSFYNLDVECKLIGRKKTGHLKWKVWAFALHWLHFENKGLCLTLNKDSLNRKAFGLESICLSSPVAVPLTRGLDLEHIPRFCHLQTRSLSGFWLHSIDITLKHWDQ